MKRSSRFIRVKLYILLLAALPVVLGAGLAIHSALLSQGVRNLALHQPVPHGTNAQAVSAPARLGELATSLERYSTLGTAACISGALLAILLIATLHRGRLGIYRRYFHKALHAASDRTAPALESLRFPDEDDLGHLGQALNGIISRLREYDRLRRDELLLADSLMRAVISDHDQALAVFDDQLTLVFFSNTFSDLMGGRAKTGLKTSDLFTDATTLEQLVQGLHKDGTAAWSQRPAADTIIPLKCMALAADSGESRRLLVRFGKSSGEYA